MLYFYIFVFSADGSSSTGDRNGGGCGVQTGLTTRLPDIHGSAELWQGNSSVIFVYIHVSPPVTVAITHLWIFTAQVLLVCLRMTHAGRNSSRASRAWWRSWRLTPQSTLQWIRKPGTTSMTAFLPCSVQVSDGYSLHCTNRCDFWNCAGIHNTSDSEISHAISLRGISQQCERSTC